MGIEETWTQTAYWVGGSVGAMGALYAVINLVIALRDCRRRCVALEEQVRAIRTQLNKRNGYGQT